MPRKIDPRPKKTRTVAGHKITLTDGVRYVASRPAAERGRKVYPVTIAINNITGRVAKKIPDLTYEQANALVNAFNNGPTSWDGRVW